MADPGRERCPRSEKIKPDTRTAMGLLIGQIRESIPFGAPRVQVCTGACDGCSIKLLDYLDTELQDWEYRLADGERPSFGDLSRLARTARKIHDVLVRNGLIRLAETRRDRATASDDSAPRGSDCPASQEVQQP